MECSPTVSNYVSVRVRMIFSKFFAYIIYVIKAVSYEGHLETLFSKASFRAFFISSIVSRSGFTTCLS